MPRIVFGLLMTRSRKAVDLFVTIHVGSRTRVRFPSISCLTTEAETFERSNNTVSLQRKFLKGSTAWVDTKPMRIPYVTMALECEK